MVGLSSIVTAATTISGDGGGETSIGITSGVGSAATTISGDGGGETYIGVTLGDDM